MGAVDLIFAKQLFVRLVLEKRQGPMRVEVGGSHKLDVLIRPLEPDEMNNTRHDTASCTVTGVWPFKGSALSSLENISRGLMPDGTQPDEAWSEYQKRLLHAPIKPGTSRMSTMMDLYPESLRRTLGSIDDELEETALRVVALVRWRMDARGGHDPVREDRGLQFSLDGTEWQRLPYFGDELDTWAEVHALIDPQTQAELDQYTTMGISQPLGHELLREAFTTRSKNPRSALLVTMTALEVGVKEYIADLVPSAEWLAFQVPTPPVVRILGEYLPKLPSRAASGVFKSPPKRLLETLTTAVQLRNTVTHKGEGKISVSRLAETMATVADVLRVLDCHRGFAWSLQYVREDVRKEWFGEST